METPDTTNTRRSSYPIPPEEAFRRRHVVIAEDDAEQRALLGDWLRYDGYEVTEVEDGQALARALEGAGPDDERLPDLVLSDLRLPLREGLEVIAERRAAGDATPVVIITGFASPQVQLRAKGLGVSAVVRKPFDLEDLRTLVALLLTRGEARPRRGEGAAPR